MQILTNQDPEWQEFCEILADENHLNYQDNGRSRCNGEIKYAREILKDYPQYNLEETIKYFESHGGHCDCKILYNVDQ